MKTQEGTVTLTCDFLPRPPGLAVFRPLFPGRNRTTWRCQHPFWCTSQGLKSLRHAGDLNTSQGSSVVGKGGEVITDRKPQDSVPPPSDASPDTHLHFLSHLLGWGLKARERVLGPSKEPLSHSLLILPGPATSPGRTAPDQLSSLHSSGTFCC